MLLVREGYPPGLPLIGPFLCGDDCGITSKQSEPLRSLNIEMTSSTDQFLDSAKDGEELRIPEVSNLGSRICREADRQDSWPMRFPEVECLNIGEAFEAHPP